MSDKDFAPLSAACVRALHDKLYEKRKTAALEIEKMVKEFAAVNNTGQIKRLLKVLGQDFAASQNAHARKGGLIGLAAVAIALGKETSNYTNELFPPILACFSDSDLRVRYYALESLYNVIKVARSSTLPHFAVIFNALSKIATDPDQSVKSASELLDRLMKDIVTESPSFDLEAIMPLLRERVYTKNSFARQFVISWISVLDAVPDINLIAYLPDLLDGLFWILDDPVLEVKKMCDTAMGEFLRRIKSDPSKVNFGDMINVLINHAHEKSDDVVQFTAITWIKEFVQLSGDNMLPHTAGILTAVLPCFAYETDARKNIKETATAVNFSLMKLITLQKGKNISSEQIDIKSVVDVLKHHLLHNSVQTKVAVLRWIHHLYTNVPHQMKQYIDSLFPALQQTLSDPADEVVQQCLVVIAEVIRPSNSESIHNIKNPYYLRFIDTLLQSFSEDKSLLDERGSFIIRQLCVLINSDIVYHSVAETLISDQKLTLKFKCLMVEHLNMILLTSSELHELRIKLKELKDQESISLFLMLYETWCYNPVALVALCLLAQCYNHVCDLIRLFGNLEFTVEFLTEIDKLVQLIESPIFAYLRLDLLEVPCDRNLVRALYGLLMLLPQTEMFHKLHTRLSCIPSLHLHCDNQSQTVVKPVPARMKSIDFKELLTMFETVQKKYSESRKTSRVKEISAMDLPAGGDSIQ